LNSPDESAWQQLSGESILREAVGRLPRHTQDRFKRAIGTGTKLWPQLGRHVLEVMREQYERARAPKEGGTR
jgi:hypothetical protein